MNEETRPSFHACQGQTQDFKAALSDSQGTSTGHTRKLYSQRIDDLLDPFPHICFYESPFLLGDGGEQRDYMGTISQMSG